MADKTNAAATGSSARSRWRRKSSARAGPRWCCANCSAARTRFNDLRRGVPRMSPTLLSKRLKELERGRRHRRRRRRPARRGRIQADRSRRGPARRHHVARLLGSALGRIVAVAEESRSVAADVGHAAQPASDAAAADAAAPSISVSGTRAGQKSGGWWSTAARSIFAASIPASTSISMSAAPLRTMTAVWMGVAKLNSEVEAGRSR